jgi:hypothetical protein
MVTSLGAISLIGFDFMLRNHEYSSTDSAPFQTTDNDSFQSTGFGGLIAKILTVIRTQSISNTPQNDETLLYKSHGVSIMGQRSLTFRRRTGLGDYSAFLGGIVLFAASLYIIFVLDSEVQCGRQKAKLKRSIFQCVKYRT